MDRRDFIAGVLAAGFAVKFSPESFAAELQRLTGRRTLVLGGTAFALGYAQQHADETLVLERGIHLAPEFALVGDRGPLGSCRSACGREFVHALEGAGLVSEGSLELPPLADFLGVHFADCGIKAFMNAEPVQIVRKGKKWQVTIVGGGGEGLVRAEFDAVLDTTDLGWRECGQEDVIGKRFTVMTTKSPYVVDLPASADWRDARLALYGRWERQARAREERIIAEAGALRCIYREGRIARMTEFGFPWVPSAQFSGLVAAYEEGCQWNFR